MLLKRLAYISLVIFIFSCSTEKNKFFNRSFHNINARYNGYFNAGELIKESLIDFHAANKDDYTKILPVFIIPDDEKSKSLYAPMDKAISKTSVVIKKHSMPDPEKKANKRDEWCKWIDDNWLVMGKAYYYKRDFQEARTRFEFVFKQYQDKPIKYEAMLWEARTWLELDDFVNANTYLERLQEKMEEQTDKIKIAARKKEQARLKKSRGKSKSKFKTPNIDPPMSPKLYDDLQMTWADFYLRKKDWTKAEDKLKKSIAITKDKKQKARLYFILGQLYQQKGDRGAANVQYYKVDKLNPEYEMEFYSRIFRALNYDGGSSASLKRQLIKMAKDEKNKDYLDQIYYALAEIAFKENDRPKGIDYLQLSVKTSTTNIRQKGLSYKRLGDLYYDEKKFIQAKSYYDSTMANLPKDYERYNQVQEKSESLKDLVDNLLVIQREDSLQKLGKMSDKELETYLDKVLDKEDAEEERRRQIEENKAKQEPSNLQANNGSNTSWYFYNPTAMAQGYAEFKKNFGTRKLEDDWRRLDKSVMADEFDPNNDTSNVSKEPDEASVRQKRLDKYAKTVPRSEADMLASNNKLMKALYNAGAIYNDRLREEQLSIQMFERLIRDFPESEDALTAHYQLYVIYGSKNQAKSDEHKNYILTNHPNSEYARIIKNPNYKKEEALAMKADERKYESVYTLYRQKQFESALQASNDVIEKEPGNSMLPNYYYLRALSYGELKQLENFEKALSETATKYPKEEVGIAATELLNYLRKEVSKSNAASGLSTYIFEDNVEHFFVLVFTPAMGSVNDAKAKISNFNMSSFSAQELKITNNFLNTEDQVVLVKKFENKSKAMDYYTAFKLTDMLKGINDKGEYFVITNKNYASFYIEKKIADYKKFFQDNYLK